MVRAFCGCNDNPDPQMFLLIFRLMLVYSLVKPVVGSNVTGDELFQTLIDDSELGFEDINENQRTWHNTSLRLLNAAEDICDRSSTGNMNLTEDERLLEFLAGYVGTKAGKLKKCVECVRTLSVPKSEYRSVNRSCEAAPSLIELRDYHDALHYPTKSLYSLITIIEKNICAVIGSCGKEVGPDTFFQISERLETLPSIPTVGCKEHRDSVLGYVIQFYLILRMHFAAKAVNKDIANCRKAAELRKMGKLIQGSGDSCSTESFVEGIEAVVASVHEEIKTQNVRTPLVDCPAEAGRRRRKFTKDEIIKKLESYAATIEEVVSNINNL